MLYCFDLDGTLIESYISQDEVAREYSAVTLLPNVAARIAVLRRMGHQVAVITDQVGVAFGYISQVMVMDKLERVAQVLGYGSAAIYDGMSAPYGDLREPSLYCFVCYSDTRSQFPQFATPDDAMRRKPSGEMLFEAMSEYDIPPEQTMYVGDRPEDEVAAQAAEVAFQWAADFFNK